MEVSLYSMAWAALLMVVTYVLLDFGDFAGSRADSLSPTGMRTS